MNMNITLECMGIHRANNQDNEIKNTYNNNN